MTSYSTEITEIESVDIGGAALATTALSVITRIITTSTHSVLATAGGVDHLGVEISTAGASIVVASVTGTGAVP